jgi:hypothetical protein
VTLNAVMATDPLVTVMGGPISLSPGESDSTSFTGTLVLAQEHIDAKSVDNTAETCPGETCDTADTRRPCRRGRPNEDVTRIVVLTCDQVHLVGRVCSEPVAAVRVPLTAAGSGFAGPARLKVQVSGTKAKWSIP